MWQLLIFMDLETFLTLNMSNKKWKLVYINQYSTFEIIESSYETGMSIIYKTKKNTGSIHNISGARSFFVLLGVHQDTKSE